jgi:hypothetical protein
MKCLFFGLFCCFIVSCKDVATPPGRDALYEVSTCDLIQGFWLPTEGEPEGFLFKDDSVFFADKNEWCHFTCTDSTITIEYYGSNNSLRYRMAGRDSLIFIVNGVSRVNIRSSAE